MFRHPTSRRRVVPSTDMTNRMVLPAAVALLVAGCSRDEDSDSLAQARRNLKIAPCASTPAIAGVAGVNGIRGRSIFRTGSFYLTSARGRGRLVLPALRFDRRPLLHVHA